MPGSSDKTRLSLAGQALAGMGAGWTNGVVAHPAELVKVRLQNQMERNKSERKYSGPWPIAKEVYQQHGIRGLYRGYAATLLFRSNMAVLFSSFELSVKRVYKLESYIEHALRLPCTIKSSELFRATWQIVTVSEIWLFSLFDQLDDLRMNLGSIDEKFDNEADVHRTIFIELDKVMSESYVRLLPALLSWPENTAVKYVRAMQTSTNNLGHAFVTFPSQQNALDVLSTVNKVSMPGTSRPFKADWAINAPHLIANPFTSTRSPLHDTRSSNSPEKLVNEFSVFVGDLSPDATEHDLMRAFQHPPNLSNPFTTCTNVKIMTDNATGSSRCFGFVRFSNEDEMIRALDEMQGIPVAGRPIRLSTATPKIKTHQHHQQQQQSHFPLHPTPHVYPLNTEQSLLALDEEAERRTQRQRELQSQTQPDHFSRLANLNSHPSTVPSSTASHIANAAVANASSDPHNTTVFVGGLSSLISEDTLRVFFAPFGAITKADAERAIERMQGFPIGGGRIRLSWGRSQSDKAAQAAAQAAQLGLGIGALGQMANLSPAQAMQLSTALQNLGNAGVTNTSVHNAIKHLAAATSGLRGQNGSPTQSPGPSLYNPTLDVFQPQDNRQNFQRQPSPLGQVNFVGNSGLPPSATPSVPSSAGPAGRADPIFYMPPDKANYPDFSTIERERSLFKTFMKPESPVTPGSSASFKSPVTTASVDENFTNLTSPNPTNPMPSPPLKAMPTNTLESYFKSREHNAQQQQHYQTHAQHKEHQVGNLDGFLASEVSGLNIRDHQYINQRATSPLSNNLQTHQIQQNSDRDIKNIWN
ncbi:RNA-binding domain-containing protein [Wallemia mellicola]|nr:RNA-binding domain-containing protein [Wallemia mellicola]